MPSAEWLDVVAFLESTGLPWPTALAAHDLRWHATMERRGGPSFPSRRRFMARWLWTGHAVRALLASESWRDPVQPPVARAVAQQSPNNRPAIAQQSPSAATANAENTGETAHVSPSNRPAIAQESPHARFPCSPITDHRTPDPSGGVASATDAGALYAVWRQSHPRAGERPTPEGAKAIKRLLVECAGLNDATVYLQWLAESQDEYARQLRGEAPWSDGRVKSYAASLTEAARSPEARLAAALVWDARGRTVAPVGPSRVKETVSPEWVTAWKRVCARNIPAADTPERLALADIGGMSAIKAMRAGFEEDQLQRQFVSACTQHANQIQRAAK